MTKNLMFLAALSVLTLGVSVSAQAKEASTCKVSTNDIGTIVGKGRSPSAAFEDAATKCFERREQLHRMKKGQSFDEDTGLAVIDSCANIKCG